MHIKTAVFWVTIYNICANTYLQFQSRLLFNPQHLIKHLWQYGTIFEFEKVSK